MYFRNQLKSLSIFSMATKKKSRKGKASKKMVVVFLKSERFENKMLKTSNVFNSTEKDVKKRKSFNEDDCCVSQIRKIWKQNVENFREKIESDKKSVKI
uniref:Uncharacterized protein n=1 Tax=Panagrolaimus sp. JU765 TaxID=591449 RepID=A0AC34R112_9BILA